MNRLYKSALLAVAVSVPAFVHAQPSHRSPCRPLQRHMADRHARHVPIVGSNIAAKTTATDARLISVIDMQYDGSSFAILDSATMAYTGLNGGFLDERWLEWNWNYEIGYSYPYASGTYGTPDYKVVQTFDAHNNVDTSFFLEWNSGTSSWDNSMRSVFTWDASGNKLTEEADSWNGSTSAWAGYYRDTYTYTSTNKVASFIEEEWNSTTSAWDTFSKTSYTRDASDRMTVELIQYWNSTTSTFDDGNRSTFTYDGSGNRTEELGEGWDGTAWVTYWKNINSDFAGLHQPGTIIEVVWNSTTSAFDSSYRYHYTYNSYDKPETYWEEEWDDISGAWAPTTSSISNRFHYETYTPAGVKQLSDPGATLHLFPVPAAATVTVKATWCEAQPFSAVIADMSGRIFSTWTVAATREYSEVVPVDRLPAGQYILTLYGKDGAVSQRFSVVK